MFAHYADYYWKGGRPYGLQEVDPTQAALSYKIVSDPYHKRLSIEKYQDAQFEKTIYDSCLLDFRHLTLRDQMAWQRETLREETHQSVYLLRNQDDRAILIETLYFEHNLCRTCSISSTHAIPISIHYMFYQRLHDPFDGVILYDTENHPVMIKTYEIDPLTGEFTNLLSEEWDMISPISKDVLTRKN